MAEATDFLVDVGNPKALDETLQALPGVNAFVVGTPEPIRENGHYVVRVFGDPFFFKFAVENQGYCTIIRERGDLL